MMDNNEDALTLTFDEANQMFGLGGINPASALSTLYERHKHHLHDSIIYELRFLLNGIKIITMMQSQEVRHLVKSLNTRFLREQFRGKLSVGCKSVHYLFLIIWHFRHCSNINDAAEAGRNRLYISKFRQQLRGTGIAVQHELYGLTEDEINIVENRI